MLTSIFFSLPAECHDKQNFFFLRGKIIIKPSSPPPLFALPFAYQRNPNGTCFAYLHLISNFKWTCQKWSSFLFWMRQDYLACIISASTCNISHKTKQADFKQHNRHLLYCLSLGILKYSCLTLDPWGLLNNNSFPIIKTKICSVCLWYYFFAMTLGLANSISLLLMGIFLDVRRKSLKREQLGSRSFSSLTKTICLLTVI